MLVDYKPSAVVAWLDFPVSNKIQNCLPAVFISLKESFEVDLRLEVWPSIPCSNPEEIKRNLERTNVTIPSLTNYEKAKQADSQSSYAQVSIHP